jgi:hypothetical protein
MIDYIKICLVDQYPKCSYEMSLALRISGYVESAIVPYIIDTTISIFKIFPGDIIQNSLITHKTL